MGGIARGEIDEQNSIKFIVCTYFFMTVHSMYFAYPRVEMGVEYIVSQKG